jgi:hypothetical protein
MGFACLKVHSQVTSKFFHFIGIVGILDHGLDKGCPFFRFVSLEGIELGVGIDGSVRQPMSSQTGNDRNPWVRPGGVLIVLGSRTFDGMTLADLILFPQMLAI